MGQCNARVINLAAWLFMDQLTLPTCILFITSTCNAELKILLHNTHLYCLMEPHKET